MKHLHISLACSMAALLFTGAALAGNPQADNPWYKQAEAAIKEKLARTPIRGKAKNVILFISDGNGTGTNYATRLYMGQKAGGYGDDYVLSYEKMPYLALVKTYSTNAQTPDSASTATAINTGVKTRQGVIGVDSTLRRSKCEDMKKATISNFAEIIKAEGKSVGIVSTARITHATPAAVYAHSADRSWEYDSRIPENCDQKDIARQLVDKLITSRIDIALGGGRRNFFSETSRGEEGKKGRRKDGRNLIKQAIGKGVQYVWNDKTFADLKLDGKMPILGLFEKSHMKYEHDRTGEPSLAEMTGAAIKHLSQNADGYYLMVEAGRVDHANHAGNAHRAVTDNEAFAKAVQKSMEMTSEQDTLIIVTADHAHAMTFNGYCGRGSPITGLCYQVDEAGEKHGENPNLGKDGLPYTVIGYLNGPGSVLKKTGQGNYIGERPLLTNSQAIDPDYIQQALIPRSSETHTGEDVTVYARGPWAHLFDGTVEQNYIFHVMNHAVHAK